MLAGIDDILYLCMCLSLTKLPCANFLFLVVHEMASSITKSASPPDPPFLRIDFSCSHPPPPLTALAFLDSGCCSHRSVYCFLFTLVHRRPGSFVSPYTLENQFVNIHKMTCWGFDWYCINSIDQIWRN